MSLETLTQRQVDRRVADDVQDSRPRIAFISHTAEWVGPTNSLTLLVTRLRAEYEILVLVAGRGPFTERLDGLGIPYVEFKALDKWDLLRLRRAIKDWGADLVYANNTHSSSRIGLYAARLAGVPFITHVRGMAWDKNRRRMGYLGKAERVVAVSDACGESVRRFVRPGRLVTVHNGIPLDLSPVENEEARSRIRGEMDIPADALVVTSIAHVMPRKGQAFGLEAFKELASSRDDARLLIVGRIDRDPEYVEQLKAAIAEAGLEDRIRIIGFRSDVRDVLAASDIFLHTAVADPHPRSVIEAMAAGLPVVAFAADGVAETVAADETGFLADVDDVSRIAQGLQRLADSPELRASMGNASRRRVEAHFTDEATAAGVARQIDAVLEGHG